MPALTSERRTAAARKAALSRSHQPGSPAMLQVERDLAVARLADYISRVVDSAPELSADQRQRLAALLRGGGLDAA